MSEKYHPTGGGEREIDEEGARLEAVVRYANDLAVKLGVANELKQDFEAMKSELVNNNSAETNSIIGQMMDPVISRLLQASADQGNSTEINEEIEKLKANISLKD